MIITVFVSNDVRQSNREPQFQEYFGDEQIVRPLKRCLAAGVQGLTKICGTVRLLCQDLSQDVRAAVCRTAFEPLAHAVGPDRCAGQLLPELVELLQVWGTCI